MTHTRSQEKGEGMAKRPDAKGKGKVKPKTDPIRVVRQGFGRWMTIDNRDHQGDPGRGR